MVVTYFRGLRLLDGGEEGREDHIIWHVSCVGRFARLTHGESDASSQIQAACSHQRSEGTDEAVSGEMGRTLRQERGSS